MAQLAHLRAWGAWFALPLGAASGLAILGHAQRACDVQARVENQPRRVDRQTAGREAGGCGPWLMGADALTTGRQRKRHGVGATAGRTGADKPKRLP
jgi:hypothetical protein